MRVLLLGARGAVGQATHRELAIAGHAVTATSRAHTSSSPLRLDGNLTALRELASRHDVVINATGVERIDLPSATGSTPLVDISATGKYIDQVSTAWPDAPLLLGAGLMPGLSSILLAALPATVGDDLDACLLLAAGGHHGAAAVEWTQSLIGNNVYMPPEFAPVRNLRASIRVTDSGGRSRRYLRADFPDHALLSSTRRISIRSYLALSPAPMTAALAAVARFPRTRALLRMNLPSRSDEWQITVRNRRTDEQLVARGTGQSNATGRLAALAALKVLEQGTLPGPTHMASLVSLNEALDALPMPSIRR